MSEACDADLQKQLFEKVKGNLIDLLGEDKLAELVDKTAQKVMFENRKSRGNWSGDRDVEIPSLFIELVTKEIKLQAEVAIREWIIRNRETMITSIKESIEKDIGLLVIKGFRDLFSYEFNNFRNEIYNKLNNIN